MVTSNEKGTVYRVSGPVCTAIGIKPAMYDIVRVGDERLMGEVIQIEGEYSIIQVYEDTSGVKPGEPVENTGLPPWPAHINLRRHPAPPRSAPGTDGPLHPARR